MLPKLKKIWSNSSEKPAASSRLEHPVVGAVTLNHSAKAKRISLSVKVSGEIKLTIPKRASRQTALDFLDNKTDWIMSTRERLKRKHPQQLILPPYTTREHQLHLIPDGRTTIRTSLRDRLILVQHPADIPAESEPVQTAIQQGIEAAWRLEAQTYLPERLARLSAHTGLPYGKVSIRNAKTRWGSCSVRDDISLSLHLMKLPDHLIDYILLHELCHTKHKNHGPKFHALLDQLTAGRHLRLRKELRNYHTKW